MVNIFYSKPSLLQALDSLESASELRNDVLGLLQDVCSTSLRLPSSYWMSGSMTIGRYIRQGGEAILSRATHVVDGVSYKVVVRQTASPDDDDWDSPQGREMLAVRFYETCAMQRRRDAYYKML